MHQLNFPQELEIKIKNSNERFETFTYIEDQLFYTPPKKRPSFFNDDIYNDFMSLYLDDGLPIKWKQNEINKEIEDNLLILMQSQYSIVNQFQDNIEYANNNNIPPSEWVYNWFNKTIQLEIFENKDHLSAVLLNSVKDDFFEESLNISGKTLKKVALDATDLLFTMDVIVSDNFKNKIEKEILSDDDLAFSYLKNVYIVNGSDHITDQIFKNKELFSEIIKNNDIRKIMQEGLDVDIDSLKKSGDYNSFSIKRKTNGVSEYLKLLKENKDPQYHTIESYFLQNHDIKLALNNQMKKSKFNP